MDISHTPMQAGAPGTRQALAEAHASVIQLGRALPLWTITGRLCGAHVARLFLAHGGKVLATTIAVEGDCLVAVREALPPGLIRFERAPTDDPAIVETWL